MIKYLMLSAALFSIGVYGVVARRNILLIIMSIELMLNAVNLALIAFSRVWLNHSGQVFMLMVMGVAAAEVATGLALVIALFRNKRTVDVGEITSLKG